MTDTRTTRELANDILTGSLQDILDALDTLTSRLEALEAGIANSENALAIQGDHGNWNYDSYMHGMFNGMEFVLATIRDREPEFRDAPDEWCIDHAERVKKGD